ARDRAAVGLPPEPWADRPDPGSVPARSAVASVWRGAPVMVWLAVIALAASLSVVIASAAMCPASTAPTAILSAVMALAKILSVVMAPSSISVVPAIATTRGV